MDLEYQGHGIAKPEGRVLFVEGVLPGETVDVAVKKKKKNHAFGYVTAFHNRSPDRVDPFCPHFDDCGGCTWQYLPYPDQLRYKQQFVAEIMRRIGGITEPGPLPTIGCDSDKYYRNKLEFSFGAKRWIPEAEVAAGIEIADRKALGFHVRGRFDRILHIDNCFLQRDPSNSILTAARHMANEMELPYYDPATNLGFIRGVMIRTSQSGEVMVVLVIKEDQADIAIEFLNGLVAAVPEISSAHYIVNPTTNDSLAAHPAQHVSGSPVITEHCGSLRFAIHPKSFYQTNSAQADRLYGVVHQWADLKGDETVLDLYCGIGSIGLSLSDRARRIVGVEYVPEAIECAKENADLNSIENAEFYAGDVRELLKNAGTPNGLGNATPIPQPNVIILDPPRAGVHPDVITELLRLRPKQIIYVSCKPPTQARDLTRLTELYGIERIQPVDMFPHTFHIENIIDLRLTADRSP